jgi:hypothetical protein
LLLDAQLLVSMQGKQFIFLITKTLLELHIYSDNPLTLQIGVCAANNPIAVHNLTFVD